jgi:hypothetical protein
MGRCREPYRRGRRLSTVDLLNRVAWFVNKLNNISVEKAAVLN